MKTLLNTGKNCYYCS